MDNITHAFVGAAIAECTLPAGAGNAVRRVFLAAGVVAANLPDIDLFYSGITAAPLGYMLHHRGHSHTLPGLVLLGGLMVAAFRVWPAARVAMAEARARFWMTVVTGLLSHLLLDASNSYGTHLFYPFDSGWFYGDTVFILEPWLWLLLGAALTVGAVTWRWRILTGLLTVAPIAGLAYVGLISLLLMGVLLAAGIAAGVATRRWAPSRRSTAALAAAAAYVLMLGVASRSAEQQTRRVLADLGGGEVLDVVLDPNPGAPWCWSVLTIEKAGGDLVARRGLLSLIDAWPAESCAASRMWSTAGTKLAAGGAIAWKQEWRTDLAQLQNLDATDCRAQAWLQFSRVPLLEDDRLADLRFENPLRENFTALQVGAPGANVCPVNLTHWSKPRADVLVP